MHPPQGDARLRPEHPLRKLLRRPELGAIGGALLVWLFFAAAAGGRGFLSLRGAANYLDVAAELGILAVAVSLLMIGGAFDLSIGSTIGAAGMLTALLSVQFGWNLWAALGAALIASLAIGTLNGMLVNRTRLPSFIITLAMLFIVRGLTIGVTRLVTGRTQIGGLFAVEGYDSAALLFAGGLSVVDPASARGLTATFSVGIAWWLGFALVGTWVLLRTRFGNWVFAIGGDENAAREMGVPVERVRLTLYLLTAFAAWLVAALQVMSSGGADTLRGEQREFFAIIAAVIGGTLLTGGYGSAIGAVFGALIVGMVQQGIVFTGVDSDWFLVFLGGMLIAAVLVNNWLRRRASEMRG
jgi:simple sugar transport system permease protein